VRQGRQREEFSPLTGGRRRFRKVDRDEQTRRVQAQLSEALQRGLRFIGERQDTALSMTQTGYFLRFTTEKYKPEDFHSATYGIRILNVRRETTDETPPRTLHHVLVFVPRKSQEWLQRRIAQYGESSEADAAAGISWLDRVEAAEDITAFWTSRSPLPAGDDRQYWEVWLALDTDDDTNPDNSFVAAARKLNVDLLGRGSYFESRVVRLVRATRDEIEQLAKSTGAIAEIRRPFAPGELLREIARAPHGVAEAVRRTRFHRVGPRIALFDTGIAHGHPMIAPALVAGGVLSADESYGEGDDWGHGTPMAGLALYGDLTAVLREDGPIDVVHELESMKILPSQNALFTVPTALFGLHYYEAVKQLEREMGKHRRVFCCAINDSDDYSGLMPTEWSSWIDRLAFSGPRLFVVSGGNVTNSYDYPIGAYPGLNDARPLLSPGQAWNAITVGGFTKFGELDPQTYPGHTTIAQAGGLAPQSRTATMWAHQWPVKPEVVFEAGNFAHTTGDTHSRPFEDLMMVSTGAKPLSQPLTSFGFTSGATALAANFAAQLWASMPQLRPETIRALMVHSAEWTPRMREAFSSATTVPQKLDWLRRFGWGVPQLERALRSFQNDTTMIVESSLAPAHHADEHGDLARHELVWPSARLAELGDNTSVRIRVTLSWFIEPDPGERGQRSRYKYQSHGYRFRMKRFPDDDCAYYVNRLLREAKPEDEEDDDTAGDEASEDTGVDSNDPGWLLGPHVRYRGCIISDEWVGTALQAAGRNEICIYPVNGWWQDSKFQRLRRESPHPYSLLVSIAVLNRPDVNIYAILAEQLQPVTVIEITP
jgi:hypothetical protein